MDNETITSQPTSDTSARALLNNEPTQAETKANGATRAPRAAAAPSGPQQPKPLSAKDAAEPKLVTAFIKAMRDYNAALIASKPRGTKQPVTSDAIKSVFFANPTISNEDCVKLASKQLGAPVKLVTVKTFRGDAVNTFKNAAAANMLSPSGKKWLELNRRK